MSKTDFLENKLLDHVLRNVAYTPPAAVYCGLFTAAPGEGGGGTEVSGNAYARQAVTFSAASGGASSNSATVTFPAATPSGWGAVTHFGIFDAATSGNLLRYGALQPSKTVGVGDALSFPATQLVCTED